MSGGKGTVCIVVADGAKARLFLDPGTGSGLRPVLFDSLEGDTRPTREIAADRPGRTFESASPTRHSYAPRVEWHEFEKHLFARRVAALVEQAHAKHAFDKLVLVAPPRALGELRAALHEPVKRQIAVEIGKDLTGLSEHELAHRLEALLRDGDESR